LINFNIFSYEENESIKERKKDVQEQTLNLMRFMTLWFGMLGAIIAFLKYILEMIKM